MLSVSVIVPTLNEEEEIGSFLAHVCGLESDLQVIVADGGSSDGTVEIAAALVRVISAPRGRGAQMNAGAREASGDVLWFLHADTRPHPGSLQAMRGVLENPEVVGGAFEYNLDHPSRFFRITENVSNRKNQACRLFFGDMGIFVWRTVFERMGGFRDFPLMEDMDLCKRLKEQGSIEIIPLRINTSVRRWLDEGILKNLVRNWALQLLWKLGVSPHTLARWYSFGGDQERTEDG
jgi:rSAM/selenodomain-associated transferase 2